MNTKGNERRTYTNEFRAEAVALAERREKPIAQVAADLGINGNMLRRWMQQTQESAERGLQPFPGQGRLRDEELARLRRENQALKDENELLKKAAAIFA
jgi:transposase